MKHTALPWKVYRYGDGNGQFAQIGNDNEFIAEFAKLDDAELTVQRCNCHEELVEALAELYDQIHDTVPIIDSYPWLSESLDKAFNALTNATK